MSDSWQVDSDVPSGVPTPPLERAAPFAQPSIVERMLQRGRLGRFEIRGRLGRGGMGLVFRAWDPRLGREVALKVVPPERAGGARALERLRREGEALANLNHPGIVRVHEVGSEEGYPFLVCELVHGAQELLNAFEPRAPQERVALLIEAARALGHAHAHGLVHRDVKPSNVLVDREGRVRVIDLGLVAGSGLERMTQSGAMVGTPNYMSPEQVAGKRDRQGPPTDVWALGVLLYRALTDAAPFEGDDLATLSGQILGTDPPPPSTLAPQVSPALDRVTLRALAKRPGERYPDGEAFARALEVALAHPEQGFAPPRRRLGWALLGVGALCAAGAGLASLAARSPTPAPSSSPSSPSPAAALASPAASPSLAASSASPEPSASSPTATPGPSDSPATAVTPALSPELARAEQRMTAGRWVEARELLDAFLTRAPNDVTALRMRAVVRHAQGDAMGGVEDVERALTLAPGEPQALRTRAELRFRLGDYRGALKDIDAVIAACPDDRFARHNRVSMLLSVQRTQDARDELAEILRRFPQDAFAYYELGVLRSREGDARGALAAFDEGIARDPEHLELRLRRGQERLNQGRNQDSLGDLDWVLEKDPDNADALVARCYAYLCLGRLREALADGERAVRLAPRNGAAWAHRAHARAALGDVDGAGSDYVQGLELEARMPQAWAGLGRVRLGRREYPGAVVAFDRALALQVHPSWLIDRGRAHAGLGEHEAALGDYQDALRLVPGDNPYAVRARQLIAVSRDALQAQPPR
ncbi:MAG: tetratricopeptide repeat protein [Planctomycetota bacterium]